MAGAGTDDALVNAVAPHQLDALGAVFIGPALKVQVVEDTHGLPEVGLLTVAKLHGEPAHHIAHGNTVLEVEIAFIILLEQLICFLGSGDHTSFFLSYISVKVYSLPRVL